MSDLVATTGLRRRSSLLAVVGAYFAAPAGFAYVQRLGWGVALALAIPLLMLLGAQTGLVFTPYGYWVMLAITFSLVAAGLVMAFRFARAMPEGTPPRWYNRWYHYAWLAALPIVAMNIALDHRGAVFGAEPFRIPSTAMQPTLTPGDFITVDYRAGTMAKIERGDIVIYIPSHHPDQRWIKRVVGLPGERVDASGESVSIDGVPLRESWRTTPNIGASPGAFEQVTLGPDDYFLMGDNRPNSEDSRYTGPVERAALLGKARTIWLHWMRPEGFDASRIGPIDSPAR